MINIQLIQDDIIKEIGLVRDENEVQKFVESLKKICKINGSNIDSYYYINKEDIPDYGEILFNNQKIVISRFEFSFESPIYIEYKNLRDLTSNQKSDENDYVIIENYAIPYDELKDYLYKRENAYERVKKALEERGYQVNRSLQGSQDGEAIVIKKEGISKWYFAALDPYFVSSLPEDEKDFQSMIDYNLASSAENFDF